nr:rice anther specific protein [Oryza sativa Japonica Group]
MAASKGNAAAAACALVLMLLAVGAEAQGGGGGKCVPQLKRLLACRAYGCPAPVTPSAECSARSAPSPRLRLQRHQHHEQPAFQMPPQPDQLLCLRRDES